MKKRNKYALLNYDMDSENVDLTERNEVEKKIDDLIDQFRVGYHKLEKEYPNAGIGDTATDEAVAHEFYQVIHYYEILNK